ncbi:sel1 repeat family protein [Evansella sp. LMS18]|uniref:tetratricopeptide repeat protein n=1 Tax=Evansella sp. LMS18 TaxID=2924033 RepID=UPI0020D032D5|nr:tetratricopeptide repeat protein [Evansella sp. LMS18]UTR12097.1 sel1 repeat family protein [Evansella sp. LMS18]
MKKKLLCNLSILLLTLSTGCSAGMTSAPDWFNNLGDEIVDPEGKFEEVIMEITDPAEQFELADKYLNGRGVTANRELGMLLLEESAAQGYKDSQSLLGRVYHNIYKDYSEALHWLKKADEQGDQYAPEFIGNMYEYGFGVPQDNYKAAEWYEKAIELDNDVAYVRLAYLYMEGDLGEKNLQEAERLLLLAVDAGNERAVVEMAYVKHLKDDYDEMVYWLQETMEVSDPEVRDIANNILDRYPDLELEDTN